MYSSASSLWYDSLVAEIVRCIKEFSGLEMVKLWLEERDLIDDAVIIERVRIGAEKLRVKTSVLWSSQLSNGLHGKNPRNEDWHFVDNKK
jgi:hypothetical protein